MTPDELRAIRERCEKMTIELWEHEEITFAMCSDFPEILGHGGSIIAAVTHLLWRLKWDRKP